MVRWFWAGVMLIAMTLTAGCFRQLTGTTVSGTISENSLRAEAGFPGGAVSLMKDGKALETITLNRGDCDWRFSCKPGKYELVAYSAGRTVSQVVDVTHGGAIVDLNFEKVVIHGDVVFPSEQAGSTGSICIQLSQGGHLVDEVVLSNSGTFCFVASPGDYNLCATMGLQMISYPVSAEVSCFRPIDLNRTASVRVILKEAGSIPSHLPGGVICVENPEGRIIDRVPIVESVDSYEIPVKAGRYRITAESATRKVVSDPVDLSDSETTACTLNFDAVVLFGELSAETALSPEAQVTILKSGTIIKTEHLASGTDGYYVLLPPDRYDVEVRVPSTGGLLRERANLCAGSQRLNLNLHKKVGITGRVTENGLVPDPEAFPTGDVFFSTADGTVRATVPLKADGTFDPVVYAGDYQIRVLTGGRSLSAPVDASRADTTVTCDFEELVLTGTVKMKGAALPPSFPVTDVSLIGSDGKKVNAGIVLANAPTFRVAISEGPYSVLLKLRGTSVEVVIPLSGVLTRSTYREIDVEQTISLLRGRVSTPKGAPSSAVTVSLFKESSSVPESTAPCDSSCNYDLYCTPSTYDLQIEGSKYVTRRYDDIYIGEGESVRDLEFTQCVVTYRFTLTTGLFNTPALFNVCVNDWCYKIGDNTDNIVQKFVYPRGPVPAYSQVHWEVPVTLDIGTTYYMLVFGVDVGSVKKWTITPTEGQTVEMTVPLLLGS